MLTEVLEFSVQRPLVRDWVNKWKKGLDFRSFVGRVRSTQEFFTHIETVKCFKFRHIHCTHGHWGMRENVSHLRWHGTSVYIVISADPWYSHLLPDVCQWSGHYLFQRPRSVPTGNRTPTPCMRGKIDALPLKRCFIS